MSSSASASSCAVTMARRDVLLDRQREVGEPAVDAGGERGLAERLGDVGGDGGGGGAGGIAADGAVGEGDGHLPQLGLRGRSSFASPLDLAPTARPVHWVSRIYSRPPACQAAAASQPENVCPAGGHLLNPALDSAQQSCDQLPARTIFALKSASNRRNHATPYPLARGGVRPCLRRGGECPGDHDRDREQRRHDPHAGPDQRVQRGAPRHHGELGDARGEHPARAGDDRHRHRRRPVRHPDHRQLRGADLGQAGLAGAARVRRRLRRRRHAAGDPRRPDRRRQALRRALLRRERVPDVPHRPPREGRAHHARGADLGVHRRRGPQDDRPLGRHQRHLPARQGRLGREHGADRLDGQQLRRALVRRGVGPAVRPARVEGRAAVLRRPDEGRAVRRAPRPTASTRT